MARKRVTTAGDRKKAARIRKRIHEGKSIKEGDREWLESYEAGRTRNYSPTKYAPIGDDASDEATEGDDSEAADDSDDSEAADDPAPIDDASADQSSGAPAADPPAGAAPEVVTAPPPPPPRPPRLGRPPRVRADDDDPKRRERDGDWRQKYRDTGKAAGREATVTQIADLWTGALSAMAEQMRAIGVQPIIEPKQLYPAIVLTLDDLLPSHVELRPQHLAVGGSTALVVQRFMRRQEIAEHQKKEQEREAYRKRNQDRRERAADPPPPEPAPAPEPAPEPEIPAAQDAAGYRPNGVSPPPITGADLIARDPSVVF